MDTLEKHAVDPSELQELRAQCQSLQQLVSALLVLVLIVSGALDIYLLRQWRMAHAELQRRGPYVAKMVAEYNQVSAPAISDFVKRLVDYEKTHPDFTQILLRYNLKGNTATGGPPGAVTAGKN
jgi:hypothetical protein